jgi:hypothetical protein
LICNHAKYPQGHIVVGESVFADIVVQASMDIESRCGRPLQEEPMARWMLMLALVLTAVSAASSSYTAYKTYLMTDGKTVPKKR